MLCSSVYAIVVTSFLAQAGVDPAKAPPLHVLRIVSGPAGTETGGTFVLSEDRSRFNRSTDREVIVLFQWDGVPGAHKLEARWRSPDGAYASNSTIDYVAKDRRFGAYWRISISPTMQLGTWSIEATVDGAPGGRHTFEITDAAVAPGPPARRALTQSELYERLARNYVLVLRQGAEGSDPDVAGGVIVSECPVATSIRSLDASHTVKMLIGAGPPETVSAAYGVSRTAGCAVVPAKAETANVLPRVTDAPRVGDRCFSMQGSADGARVPLEGQITGLSSARDDLKQDQLVLTSVRMPVFKKPGIYRAEALLDGKPAWRAYLRITP